MGSSSLGTIGGSQERRFHAKSVSVAVVPDAARPATSDPLLTADQRTLLFRWNAAMTLFHAALAVTTLAVGDPSLSVETFKPVLNFTSVNNSAGRAWKLTPVFAPADGLYFTAIVVSFFLLSAVFHFGNAFVWRDYYLRQLNACLTPTRWIEYSFSAPLMQLAVAYTLGVRDRAALFSTAILVATTMPFGYWTEMIARPSSPDTWSQPLSVRLLPWALGHVPQAAAWTLIFLQFYDGASSQDEMPDFVHAILFGEFVLFFSFGAAAFLSQLGPPRLFYRGELGFQVLSLVSKGLLGILLMTNVLIYSSFDDIYAAG